jgi:ubiquitin fusion degradation protein 1
VERRALLEFALRKFSFLSQGSEIAIPYHKHSYRLKVLETKPAPVISITDTDLQTELVQPTTLSVSSMALMLRFSLSHANGFG